MRLHVYLNAYQKRQFVGILEGKDKILFERKRYFYGSINNFIHRHRYRTYHFNKRYQVRSSGSGLHR